MLFRRISIVLALAAAALVLVTAAPASAVPSFARQTGFSCTQCHTQFPELTPFGRAFKASGYTMSMTKTVTEKKNDRSVLELLGIPPLAVMLQASYTHTNKPQEAVPGSPAKNDDVLLPQQVSLFYAGKIAPKLGAFMQLTYDGVAGTFGMDNTDIRFAQTTSLGGKDLIVGLTLNNNPTVQDLWNSTPAWGFPFASSSTAPGTIASPLIAGGLAQQVAGLGAYAFWNDLIYAEFSVYHSAPLGITRPVGTPCSTVTPTCPAGGTDATNVMAGVAPYWRLVLQRDFDKHSISLGTFGMATSIYPGGTTLLNGPTNHFIDTAVDAQYQYIGDKHIATATASWIHENSFLDATMAGGGAGRVSHLLDTYSATGGYIFDHTLGVHLSYFATNGTVDDVLYAEAPMTGSRTHQPFTNGLLGEVSYTPWWNTKFVLQYTAYFNVNGAGTNYDGNGRDASANNTLYLLAWLSY